MIPRLLFMTGIHTLLWCRVKFSAIDHPPVKGAWAVLSQAVQIAVFRNVGEPAGDDNFPDYGYWWYFINALLRLIIHLGVWERPEEGEFPAKAPLFNIGAMGGNPLVPVWCPVPFLVPFTITFHILLQVAVSPKTFTIRSGPAVSPVSVIVGYLGIQSKRLFPESCSRQNKKSMTLSCFEKSFQTCSVVCFLDIKT